MLFSGSPVDGACFGKQMNRFKQILWQLRSERERESEREGGGYAVPKFNHKTIVSTEMMKQDEIPWINIIT